MAKPKKSWISIKDLAYIDEVGRIVDIHGKPIDNVMPILEMLSPVERDHFETLVGERRKGQPTTPDYKPGEMGSPGTQIGKQLLSGSIPIPGLGFITPFGDVTDTQGIIIIPNWAELSVEAKNIIFRVRQQGAAKLGNNVENLAAPIPVGNIGFLDGKGEFVDAEGTPIEHTPEIEAALQQLPILTGTPGVIEPSPTSMTVNPAPEVARARTVNVNMPQPVKPNPTVTVPTTEPKPEEKVTTKETDELANPFFQRILAINRKKRAEGGERFRSIVGAGTDAAKGIPVYVAVPGNNQRTYPTLVRTSNEDLMEIFKQIWDPEVQKKIEEAKTNQDLAKANIELLGKIVDYESNIATQQGGIAKEQVGAFQRTMTETLKLRDEAMKLGENLPTLNDATRTAIDDLAATLADPDVAPQATVLKTFADGLANAEVGGGLTYAAMSELAAKMGMMNAGDALAKIYEKFPTVNDSTRIIDAGLSKDMLRQPTLGEREVRLRAISDQESHAMKVLDDVSIGKDKSIKELKGALIEQLMHPDEPVTDEVRKHADVLHESSAEAVMGTPYEMRASMTPSQAANEAVKAAEILSAGESYWRHPTSRMQLEDFFRSKEWQQYADRRGLVPMQYEGAFHELGKVAKTLQENEQHAGALNIKQDERGFKQHLMERSTQEKEAAFKERTGKEKDMDPIAAQLIRKKIASGDKRLQGFEDYKDFIREVHGVNPDEKLEDVPNDRREIPGRGGLAPEVEDRAAYDSAQGQANQKYKSRVNNGQDPYTGAMLDLQGQTPTDDTAIKEAAKKAADAKAKLRDASVKSPGGN